MKTNIIISALFAMLIAHNIYLQYQIKKQKHDANLVERIEFQKEVIRINDDIIFANNEIIRLQKDLEAVKQAKR